ncbi:PucR family transcriptional regulator [Flintibacter sp. P01028]|uniref:PucR family transcriptional regulator n=1 Tax=Flintibacter sp. P01028 TaxID=3342382 RepID=UPI0035B62DA4
MLTCRDLFQLESFKEISLVAGRAGLDNKITWPYPRHTKVISPWVRGGEFILVSGYEYGVNDTELLELLDEAEMNNLSGILVEGGINFKKISQRVIDYADKLSVPLFFAPRVVSFLDICREMTNIILEATMYERYTSSLLKKLVESESISRKGTLLLVKEANVPINALYQVILFTAAPGQANKTAISSPTFDNLVHEIFNSVQKACSTVFHNANLKTIVYLGASSLAYLIYGKKQDDLIEILQHMKEIRTQHAQTQRNCRILLSSSSIVNDCTEISRAYQQSMYTSSLMCGGIVSETFYSFDDLGSYQLPFYIDDKNVLFDFRDRYLKKLIDNKQLLDTLRTYFAFSGNMMRTAEALFIHRNTLSYRLERIEALTEKNLSDPSVYQDFLNALMLMDIYPY